jgi:nickel-dependent lactate racemase
MKKLLLFLSLVLTATTVSAQTIRKGDANNDKKVNRVDVLEVSDAIMGKPSERYNEKNADANSDDKVDAADIVVIVNMIKNDSENPILIVWKADGTKVDDKYVTWKCIFKPGFKNYIVNHFNNGMLVQVKGEVMPYAIDHERLVDGYSVIGQTINMASYPKSMLKQERKMIKESLENSNEKPNLQDHLTPDF